MLGKIYKMPENFIQRSICGLIRIRMHTSPAFESDFRMELSRNYRRSLDMANPSKVTGFSGNLYVFDMT